MSQRVVGTPAPSSGGGIAGTTGATDNRLLRADGTGGATIQSSSVTVDDSGSVAIPIGQTFKVTASGNIGYATEAGPTFFDVNAGMSLTENLQALSGAVEVIWPDSNGTVVVGSAVAATVGAAGPADALPATPLGYLTIKLPAGTSVKIPYYTV